MITIVAERNNGGPCPAVTRRVSVGRAFISLVQYELGFGGRVTSVSPTSISVRTRVFGCVDDTHFSGTEQEMSPLLRAVVLNHELRGNQGVDNALVERVMQLTRGVPLLVVHGSDIIMGQPVARAVAAAVVCQTESDFRQLTALRESDMYAIVELVLDGASLEASLSLAA